MSANKTIHIFSAGTASPIAPHLELAARAFGQTGQQLVELCREIMPHLDTHLHATRRGGGVLDTSADVAAEIAQLKADPRTKIIFMPVAVCDFDVAAVEVWRPDGKGGRVHTSTITDLGKHAKRLTTHGDIEYKLVLKSAPKVIQTVRRDVGDVPGRKDIFLIGFKTTAGATVEEMYLAGLGLRTEAGCNLVLVNDAHTGLHLITTPEEFAYPARQGVPVPTTDRQAALRELVEIAALRSHLTFTRSLVKAGEAVPWDSDLVPAALRQVVNYCIAHKAYKPFRVEPGQPGVTVGHFAAKLSDTEFLTSRRKTDFNDLPRLGLVRVETDGPDTVLAYGAKPSVGGQSQRIVFKDHPSLDCIVHFHCPILPGSQVPVVSQREYECGSHECGQNTSRGLKQFGNLWAVYLEGHGPNIVFSHAIDPQEVIAFIQANFDLAKKTGGYVTLEP